MYVLRVITGTEHPLEHFIEHANVPICGIDLSGLSLSSSWGFKYYSITTYLSRFTTLLSILNYAEKESALFFCNNPVN
jgi:hypothetical protein